MKKSIFLFFAAILCAMSVNAKTLYLNPGPWNVDGAWFAAYFFGNGETWAKCTDTDSDGIYEVEAPDGYPKVIFVRKNPANSELNWDDKYNQTDDITIPTDANNLCTITGWGGSDYNWSTYTPPTEPVKYTWTVAGTPASVFEVEWNPEHAANDMVEQADGTYKWEKTNIEFADESSSVQFKVCQEHAWTVAHPSSNYELNISGAGIYTVTITFNTNGNTVNAVATKTGEYVGEAPTHTYSVTGSNADLFGTAWDPAVEANLMETADNVTYTWEKEGVTLMGNFEMKVVQDKAFSVAYPAQNKVVEITEPAIYTVSITFNATSHDIDVNLTKTGEAVIPPVKLYFVNTGNWTDLKAYVWADGGNPYKAWEESESMTDTGDDVYGFDVYSYEFPSNYNRIIFKGANDQQTSDNAYDAAKPYYCNGVWYASLSEIPAPESLTYTVTVPEGTEECWIAGEMNNWTLTKMNPGAAANQFTLDIVGAAIDHEYKYACKNDWAYAEVREADENGNSNRKAWTVLDEVGEWCNPTYQLKGVGGWGTEGIELVQNPETPKEYMLTCQSIAETDAVKVVKVVNGAIPEGGYYGSVKDGVAVTVNYDDDGNIKLPAGTYDFYFDTETGQLWIQEATECETEPEVETIKVYDAVATNNDGELTIMGETSDGKDVMVAVYGFDENVANSTLEAMFIIGSWEESPWLYIEETATWDDTAEPITLSVTVEGTVVTVTGTFTSENNITYDLTISGIIQATPQAEPIHYDIDDAVCIFAEDKLQISSESTGVTAIVYVGEELLSGTYDADIKSSDIYAMGACTLVVDGEKITFTFEGSGWDVWDNEVPVTANISGTLSDTNGGIPMTVTNLFTSEDTQEKTLTLEGSTSYMGANYGFILILENYDGGYGEYALVTSAEEGEGSLLGYPYRSMTRYANASGSMTKSYDNELGTDVYKGTISATTATGEEYVIDLTMYYIEPEAIDVIIPDANITIDSDNKLTMTGSWNSYTVSVELADFSAEAEYAEAFIFVEPEYGMLYCGTPNKPIITVNDNTVTLQGLFVNMWDSEALHNVSISGTLPVEETPDYTRAVGNNQFGTICLPFGGTITGAVLYECVGSEPGKVYLGSVTTLAAGVPYIFQATATELAVYSDGTTATEAGSRYGLHGTFVDETVVAAGNYILLGNTLRPSDGEAKVNANRAYLVMSEVPVGAPQQMPGRKYIGMSVQGENEATGVEDLFTTDAPVKVIENGQLIIIRDGVKYNIQGQVIR